MRTVFKCKFCGDTFRSKGARNNHSEKAHQKGAVRRGIENYERRHRQTADVAVLAQADIDLELGRYIPAWIRVRL